VRSSGLARLPHACCRMAMAVKMPTLEKSAQGGNFAERMMRRKLHGSAAVPCWHAA